MKVILSLLLRSAGIAKAQAGFLPEVTYRVGINPAGVAVGDMNGDGKLDIAVANMGKNFGGGASYVSILLGNGDGTFQPQDLYQTSGMNGMGSVILEDLNGDNRPDIVSFGSINVVSYLLNKGDGSFQDLDFSRMLQFRQIQYP